jgi:hypothetical protein
MWLILEIRLLLFIKIKPITIKRRSIGVLKESLSETGNARIEGALASNKIYAYSIDFMKLKKGIVLR